MLHGGAPESRQIGDILADGGSVEPLHATLPVGDHYRTVAAGPALGREYIRVSIALPGWVQQTDTECFQVLAR